MEEFYKYFSWGFIAIGGVTGIGLLIRHLAQAKVNYYFNKRLEQYKHDLAIITENAKYDISKKMFDFEAYASKKHVVYPELFSLTFGSLQEVARFRHNFELDMQSSMRELDSDELEAYFDKKLLPVAKKLANAYEYLAENMLYLSKDVANAYKEALDTLSDLEDAMENRFRINYKNVDWQDSDTWLIVPDEEYNSAADKVHTLKEIVYKELSYTHFEEIEKKEEALS